MKTCILSVFKDGTGYSNFGQAFALSLDSIGHDLVCRNIKLASQHVEPHPRINELLAKEANDVDAVIQHCLGPILTYHHGYKNYGMVHFETTNFRTSNWQYSINCLDHLLVSCEENKQAALDSGVNIPISVVPIGLDPNKYKEKSSWPQPLELSIGTRYCFYHIGDWSYRKGSLDLVKAYFETFNKNDHVVLILKCYCEGKTEQESEQMIKSDIENLKSNMRLYPFDMYPPVIILAGYYTADIVERLHVTGDCFISLERGAAWNLPAFYAAAYGKWCIVNGWGGQSQFLWPENGILLNYTMTPVYGMSTCPYPNLYTAREYWAEADKEEFKVEMKKAYDTKPIGNPDALFREFSYESAGRKIEQILHA